MTPFNPDDWKDVFVLVFLALCSVVTAGLPLWSKLKKIDNQVSNSHDENLRDEITRGFAEVHQVLHLNSRTLYLIQEQLNTERYERIEGDKRRTA